MQGHGVSDDDVSSLYREVNKFALASHLLWCVWGLLQQVISTLDLDFTGYAAARFVEYQKKKDEFYAL